MQELVKYWEKSENCKAKTKMPPAILAGWRDFHLLSHNRAKFPTYNTSDSISDNWVRASNLAVQHTNALVRRTEKKNMDTRCWYGISRRERMLQSAACMVVITSAPRPLSYSSHSQCQQVAWLFSLSAAHVCIYIHNNIKNMRALCTLAAASKN